MGELLDYVKNCIKLRLLTVSENLNVQCNVSYIILLDILLGKQLVKKRKEEKG